MCIYIERMCENKQQCLKQEEMDFFVFANSLSKCNDMPSLQCEYQRVTIFS